METDLLYCSHEVEVQGLLPYYVALDRERQEVCVLGGGGVGRGRGCCSALSRWTGLRQVGGGGVRVRLAWNNTRNGERPALLTLTLLR